MAGWNKHLVCAWFIMDPLFSLCLFCNEHKLELQLKYVIYFFLFFFFFFFCFVLRKLVLSIICILYCLVSLNSVFLFFVNLVCFDMLVCLLFFNIVHTRGNRCVCSAADVQPASSTCVDKLTNCAAYGHSSCVAPYEDWAKQNCAKTCNKCCKSLRSFAVKLL